MRWKHKRDITMDPVQSSLDWKLDFLKDFADFLQLWESSSKPGLSKETFLALWHSCRALADCSAFLLDRRGFNYVLLGHLHSDAIETRLGWLRQLVGANYYISMRQVIEGDWKIRALSLLKFSHLSLASQWTHSSWMIVSLLTTAETFLNTINPRWTHTACWLHLQGSRRWTYEQAK